MRGVGITAALSGGSPSLLALFAVLTQLGDAWFVFVLFTLVYWFGDDRVAEHPRRAGATLIALGLCALGATVALKAFFALPRPPGAGTAPAPTWLPAALRPVFESAATGDGFGFPSGHAIGSTFAYGGAAVLCDRLSSARRRLAAAAGVVGVVTLSRLVLGVHYFADVAVGAVVAVGLLLVVLRVAGGESPGRRGSDVDPARAFLVALGLTGLALVVAVVGNHPGEVFEAGIGVGSAAGGVVGWRRVGGGDPLRLRTALPGLVVAGGLWGGTYALEPPLPLAVLGGALAVGLIVALPGLATRWRGKTDAETTANVSQ